MVPVVVIQSGCTVTLAVGGDGAVAGALMISTVAADTQLVVVFFTVTLYVADTSPLKVPEAW
jgi:hypothetical protein